MTMLEEAPAIIEPAIDTEWDIRIVEQARDLFADYPTAWTCGVVARDTDDGELGSHRIKEAAKVCAIGALYKYGLPVSWMIDHSEGMDKSRMMMSRLACFSTTMYGKQSVIVVNDELGREAVINVFNKYLSWREDHALTEHPPGYENVRALPF
jgi:hypothetical protein